MLFNGSLPLTRRRCWASHVFDLRATGERGFTSLRLVKVFHLPVPCSGNVRSAKLLCSRSEFRSTVTEENGNGLISAEAPVEGLVPEGSGPQSLWSPGGSLYPSTGGILSLTGEKLSEDKEIVMVRHGLSTWNVEGRIQGNTDESKLTPKGEEQARQVREALLQIPFDSCFASPITRARRSAEIIWEGRDGDLIFLEPLREANLMLLQGMRNVDAEKEFPELFHTWREAPHELCIEGEYPVVDQWDRASSAWKDILAAPGRLHLVVTHKSILRAMVCVALGLPPAGFRAIDIHNSGVSRFRVNRNGEAMLVNLNLTSHMHVPGVMY
uniref:Serine/threonine-protein phosphatase PGAM5 n=1 Tax=Tetraselmis sp. GSL018 TaxID=582737 RepID=A0A061RH22_9CHLO|mmetsp:Transcript_43071/g.102267  ORF Transcript_43071/g.102267 Transcript_43071/m.102267 type:complete len:326 (+) Transcript_43071:126-1103(+)